MKKVVRRLLGETTREHFKERQAQVDAEADLETRAKKAGALWDAKKAPKAGKAAFTEVEQILCEMCNAPRRCMYCENSEAWDVEHVKPKSKYPEDAFNWDNFLLACSTCNTRFKGSKYHVGFLDPSAPGFNLWERWTFNARNGQYEVLREGDEGAQATLNILGFDTRRSQLARSRCTYVLTLIEGIRSYGKAKRKGREDTAKELARTLCLSFPAIVEWLLVEEPSPDDVPETMREGLADVMKVKKRFPEILVDAFPPHPSTMSLRGEEAGGTPAVPAKRLR
jgi:uncharacterized protein (TIGR02646 family)